MASSPAKEMHGNDVDTEITQNDADAVVPDIPDNDEIDLTGDSPASLPQKRKQRSTTPVSYTDCTLYILVDHSTCEKRLPIITYKLIPCIDLTAEHIEWLEVAKTCSQCCVYEWLADTIKTHDGVDEAWDFLGPKKGDVHAWIYVGTAPPDLSETHRISRVYSTICISD